MDLQLKGKIAFISGSTSGIGLAIARRLAEEGADVVVNGRSEGKVKEAVDKIQFASDGGKIRGIAADLSSSEGCRKALSEVPYVDILINNLGIFELQDFFEITDQDWERFFKVNVMSGIRLGRHYLKRMLEKNWGRIIFISSESGVQIPSDMIHYGMTKTAQLAVSRGMAELTKGTAVTVNSVLPGPTLSEGVQDFVQSMAEQQQKSLDDLQKEFFQTVRPTSLLQRFAHTDEVANMVAYLSSPLASATNGAAIRVDGGIVKTIA
jgi:NAD(P)-dependent dehydrogenase (short-subunit alcohol dehydrogenase family)